MPKKVVGKALLVSVAATGCTQYEFAGEDLGLGFDSSRGGQEGLQGGLSEVLYGPGDCTKPGPGVFGFG